MDGLLTGGLTGMGSGLLTGGLLDLLAAEDPGPGPDPEEGPGRVVVAVKLTLGEVPALKLETP